MSWKAFEFDSRKEIGVYPDEMSMAKYLREHYPVGERFIVENDDGREFEAFRDTATVKIVSAPSLAEIENEDMYEDENYSSRDSG